ncbi:helix-turn-helix transcriptional regulator [Nocardiopsis rhodophaea]|uniref:helix-turn-helix domain-containing protein n=1 Tax=Nocardiopsis rhodophaea TaxID=280238 RepID=UPI0031D9B77F
MSCNQTTTMRNMEQTPFASEVAKLRELAGLTQRQLAERVRASPSAICRWEGDQATPRRDHVERLDKALNAKGCLLRVWAAQTSGSALPHWMRDAARLEEAATSIEYVSPVLVPGLLQCREYAAMVFREGQPLETPEGIDRLVTGRCGRYEQLRKLRDPWVTAVFPSSALTCVPDDVRKAQAAHLLALVEQGRVRVHLVPEGTLLVGITSPVLLVRLAEGGRAASSDHISGNFFLDRETDWERLDELVKRAVANALPSRQSVTLLGELQ